MKTVLLTGASGFLGSHLLKRLVDEGYKVIIVKRSNSNLSRINHLLKGVDVYDINYLEKAFIDQVIDVVIHTACQYGRNSESLSDIVQSNLVFGLTLLDNCLKFNVKTFINTDTLLDESVNPYTRSKKQFLDWLQQVGDQIQIINLRLEHMYGPKDSTDKLVPWFLSEIKAKVTEIKLTDGKQLRDFVYIDDVVSAFLVVLDKSSNLGNYDQFDVGTGESISVRCFLELLKSTHEEMYGKITTKLAFGEVTSRNGSMASVFVDNKALVGLGWHPKATLKASLIHTIDSYN